MKLQTFFEKFDLFANAPNAVAKMRELVLELAVQGRLVPQESKDEPAQLLLERIASTAKARGRPSDEPDDANAPFAIPETWTWVRLLRVLTKLTDGTHHSPPNGPSGDFMYVTAKNIKTAGVQLDRITYVSKEVHEEIYSRCNPSYGDVLYIKDGATTGITTINQIKEPFSMLSSVALLKPSKAVFNHYLLWAMRSPFFYAETRGAMKGAAITRVTLSAMAASLLPLPPLAEQKRIVAKVEKLMALLARLEAQQEERTTRHFGLARASLARFTDAPTSVNLDSLFEPSYAILPTDLRKTILTLAIKGKLVPQDINDESALTLLDKIFKLKSRLAKEREIRGPISVDPMAADCGDYEIPPSWTWVRFGEIMINRDGERIPVRKEERETKAKIYNYYGASGVIDKIDNFLFDKPLLLIGEDGANLVNRSTPIAFIARGKYWVNNHAHVLDGISENFLRYIQLHINAINLERYVTGSAQPKMNQAKMNSIPIALPPLAEQQRIVAKVDELMVLVDTLENQLNSARTTANTILESAVAKLTGTESRPKLLQHTTSMKSTTGASRKPRARMEPLRLSTQRFILRRFKMKSEYRSLGAFDCNYHLEEARPNEASPICLVGLNGSGKSNLIEAIAEVFCFLELINLPWKKVESASSRYRANRHRFELEYTLTDSHGERLIRVRKEKKSGAQFFIVKNNGVEEVVAPGRDQLLLLPRKIVGYSSGLNETVSHPFLRTKTIYSEEVRDAAPPEGVLSSGDDRVFDTRTLYMDYESNAAVLICNFIFGKPSELAVFDRYTRVRDVSSFGLHFNRKRAGKSGVHSIVRLTGELHSYLRSFARCAGVHYDESEISYDFSFKLTSGTRKLFRQEFKTAENLFMTMHKWSLLNALVLSDGQRNVYLRSDITKGALERPPSVPPSDRIFDIVDLKLNLSVPKIEIDYSGLSDGEHQFVQVFGTAMLFSAPGTLFLFDEPESHFNPEWRTQFNLILNGLPNASRQEYVISTHSPFIVSGSRKSNVYKFTRTGSIITFKGVDFETYGASFDVLLKKLFSIDSLIDQSAKEELQEIIKRGKVDEMKEAVEDFAESKEKRKLYEAIIQKEEGK